MKPKYPTPNGLLKFPYLGFVSCMDIYHCGRNHYMGVDGIFNKYGFGFVVPSAFTEYPEVRQFITAHYNLSK